MLKTEFYDGDYLFEIEFQLAISVSDDHTICDVVLEQILSATRCEDNYLLMPEEVNEFLRKRGSQEFITTFSDHVRRQVKGNFDDDTRRTDGTGRRRSASTQG